MNEESSLLPRDIALTDSGARYQYSAELANIARAIFPVAVSFGLQNVVQAWSILLIGHLGTFELAVASYCYMFISCNGSIVTIGGATVLVPLCGQAWHPIYGVSNPKILGLHLQSRLLIVSGLFFVELLGVYRSGYPLIQVRQGCKSTQ